MSFFSHLRRIYSLDTLDKRFTASPRAVQIDPAKPTAKEDSRSRTQLANGASPSLWKTPEFLFYYTCFIIIVPLMFKAVYDVSQPSHPNYKNYEHLLSPGWIPGRKVDNSDSQYSGFRDNVPYLFGLVLVHPFLRKIYNTLLYSQSSASQSSTGSQLSKASTPATQAEARLSQRVKYDLIFAVVFVCALHGFSALKILILLSTNYLVAKRLPRVYVVPMTWLFNITILFANELCHGYQFATIANSTVPWTVWDPNSNWGTFFDDHSGLMPRWEIFFNITVLRLISFNMDSYWSSGQNGEANLLEKKQLDPSNLSDRDRVNIPAKPEDYSFQNYLAYALYSPLYIAGPILTFNEYISQARYAPKTITAQRTAIYGFRFLVCILTMELMLHFLYAVAISKAKPAWEIYTPFQLSMLGYFNLHIIWLKLLIPWRFFRLWALMDGMDPPENMVRCMSNNYSVLAFWRGWHKSFNRWIVRYIYIPMGGSGGPGARGKWSAVRSILNYLAVFTFVAMWHDIQLRLLVWGWLVTLFILPEVLASYAFPKRKWQDRRSAYRMICGVGAVGNILMLMAANLVGFAVGLDGLMGLVHGIVGSYSGLFFLAAACATLFVGVQVMFETREEELRHGIHMKC